MKATNYLKKIASKLGLVEVVNEVQTSRAVEIKTITISLSDLQAQSEKDSAGKESIFIPEVLIDFDNSLEILNIKLPEHGWTANKIAKMIREEELKSKSRSVIKDAILNVLKSEDIPLEDIIKDAMSRDKALDSFEQIFHGRLKELIATRKREIEELHEEILRCQDKIKNIKTSIQKDKSIFKEWVQRKIVKEQELFNVATLLTEKTEIDVGPVVNIDEGESEL